MKVYKMNTLKVFFVFYVLYITTFFFNPCFCEDADYYSEIDDGALDSIDTAIKKKKKRKSVAIALLSSGLVASVIGVLYYMYKSHNKGRHDWNKGFNFFPFNKQTEYKQPDGEKPSTSTKYEEPLGVNKVNIKGKLKENNNDIDVPLKRFNTFMDNVKLAAKHHFSNLSNEQQKYLIKDYDYLRKIVQTLDENKDVNISRAQEDIAVLGVEHFLKEQYQPK
ncbi:hypothetical protein YYC_01166 [Plasmodium yoelii 17X]|nr:hypothetical protein YYC_01166 [Plasmodium yoelii 17X]